VADLETPTESSVVGLPTPGNRWRVADLVVVAVIGAAFGVVYWAWNQLWLLTSPLFVAFPPAQGFLYGVWMLPQVLAAFIVRRRGAALFGSMAAVVVSAFLGNVFGLTVLLYGLVQGGAAELVFALTRYRVWIWPIAGLATALAAAAGAGLDLVFYYPLWASAWKVAWVVTCAGSGLVLGCVTVPLVMIRLRRTGVLEEVPA